MAPVHPARQVPGVAAGEASVGAGCQLQPERCFEGSLCGFTRRLHGLTGLQAPMYAPPKAETHHRRQGRPSFVNILPETGTHELQECGLQLASCHGEGASTEQATGVNA